MYRNIDRLSIGGVILFFVLLYVLPLGARPLIIPDESRYAEIPQEMLLDGDWIVPHLDGIRYFEKPILGYWLTAASISLWGKNNFALRFPSVIATGLTAYIIFLFLRREAINIRVALLSSAVFLTCIEVFAVGQTNLLDGVLCMFISLVVVFFYFSYQERNKKKAILWLFLSGIAAGLAFLTKGFIALVIPMLSIFPFLIWSGIKKEQLKYYWIFPASLALVALPWVLAIAIKERDFWSYFIWTEHINRFLSPEAQHREPLWYFLPVLGWGSLPWIVLAPAAISGLRKFFSREPIVRISLCWFLLTFIFFSLSRGKLITYILPCFPPLAILLALGLSKYLGSGRTLLVDVGIKGISIIIGLALVGLMVIQVFDLLDTKLFNCLELWKWVLAINGLLVWIILLYVALKQNSYQRKVLFFCLAPAVLMFSSHFIFPYASQYGKAPMDFLREHVADIPPDSIVVSDGHCISALCWMLGRKDISLLESFGELEYGLSYPDARNRGLNLQQFNNLILGTERTRRIFLFLDVESYLDYQASLPQPLFAKTGTGFILAGF